MGLSRILVAAIAVAGCVLTAVPATAAGESTAELGPVRSEGSRLHVVFSARVLANGTVLDPGAVQAELDGTSVSATAEAVAADPNAPPPPDRAALVVLDTSGSMGGSPIQTARGAAGAYLAALPADVRVGLVVFSAQPVLTVPITPDRQQVVAALDQVRPRGTSALLDAVALAADTLSGVAGERRMLVLSDGEDVGSHTSLDGVTALLAQHAITVDVVALAPAPGVTTSGRDRIARESGGEVLAPEGASAPATAFAAATVVQQLAVTVEVPRERAGAQVRLTVRVPAGEELLVAEALARTPTIVEEAGEVTPAAPAWLLEALLVTTFLVLLGLGCVLFGHRRRIRGTRRLDEVKRYRLGAAGAGVPATRSAATRILPVRALLSVAERLVEARGLRERIAVDLDLAGIPMRPAEWVLVRFGVSAVFGLVLAAMTGEPVVGGLIGTLLGWFGGRIYLKKRISRRRNAFGEQLPDMLQLVAGALQSGFSLAQALDSVVREGTQPIAGEIARSLARTRLGVSVEDALDKAAERMCSADLTWVVMAVRIQREVGGNLAELLLTTMYTMRERATVRRQVKALTAEGRLSAYVLLALPIGIGVWMMLSRRDYIEPLYTRPLGWGLLAVAVVCISIGWFWMSRLVKVEV